MEKAYILLAHKNPVQVNRMISKLDDGKSYFFLHIDKKVKQRFLNVFTLSNKIILIESIETDWGSFGLVMATLNAMKSVKETQKNFERIILLSGQDYPIKSNKFIDDFLSSSTFNIFMEWFKIPASKWSPRGGLYRFDKYFFGIGRSQKLIAKSINFLSIFIKKIRRKLPGNMEPYGGSQWWIIDNYSLNFILKYIDENPRYSDFHKFTFAADEVFFQTLLMDSNDQKILNNIYNGDKRFFNWSDSANPHPEVLKENSFDKIIKSDALFARKFDSNIDSEILSLIDKYCLDTEKIY